MPTTTVTRSGSRVLHRPNSANASTTSLQSREDGAAGRSGTSSSRASVANSSGLAMATGNSNDAGAKGIENKPTPSAGRSMIARLPSIFRHRAAAGKDRTTSTTSAESPPRSNTPSTGAHGRSFSSSLPRPTAAIVSPAPQATTGIPSSASMGNIPKQFPSTGSPSSARMSPSPSAQGKRVPPPPGVDDSQSIVRPSSVASTPTKIPSFSASKTTPSATLSGGSAINGVQQDAAPTASSPSSGIPRLRMLSDAKQPGSQHSRGLNGNAAEATSRSPGLEPSTVTGENQAHPAATVPPMWRTSSYEGSTKAYVSASPSMSRSLSASRRSSHAKLATTGVKALQELEAKYSAASNATIDNHQASSEQTAIVYRIRMLRKLVQLRGERVLDSVEVDKVVLLEGANLHMSAEEELQLARNGASVSSPALSVESGSDRGKALTELQRNRGPIFGVKILDGPPLAYAVSIIGGQRHQLPILVFSLVEAIFRRGLDTAGIFRMNGNPAAINRLVEIYNTYPSYGDDLNLDQETIYTLCDLLKRYLKDLPEPILSKELWALFVQGCLLPTAADEQQEHARKLAAAQIIFRLLPRKNTSLLIYLVAFLFQLPLHSTNRLTVESISVIFGPHILAPRPGSEETHTSPDRTVKRSQEGLKWLLDNWDDSLSQDLLDEDYDCLANVAPTSEEYTDDDAEDEDEDVDEGLDESGRFGHGQGGIDQSPNLRYSPHRVTTVHDPMMSPVQSMVASPMVHARSQDSEASGESSSADGFGRALSPDHTMSAREDQAARQRVVQYGRARKSSFNIDPELNGDVDPQAPVPKLQSEEADTITSENSLAGAEQEAMADPAEGTVASSRDEYLGAASEFPHLPRHPSFEQTENPDGERHIQGKDQAGVAMPGSMPMSSMLARTPVPDSQTATPRPDHAPDGFLPQSGAGKADSEAVLSTSPGKSDFTSGPRSTPTFSEFSYNNNRQPSSSGTSVKDIGPLHSRKESTASSRFGPSRNGSYTGASSGLDKLNERPISSTYARSDIGSDIASSGFPEEIASDPNAARLFGSLGELFATEKRRTSEHQAQLKTYQARAREQEEHLAALHKEVLDRESRTRELEREVAAAKDKLKAEQELADQKEALAKSLAGAKEQAAQREAAHAIALEQLRKEKEAERARYAEEMAGLKAQLELKSRERDTAHHQLDSIRSLLASGTISRGTTPLPSEYQ